MMLSIRSWAVCSAIVLGAVLYGLPRSGSSTLATAAETTNAGQTNLWSLSMIQMPDDWAALRINTSTGQTWRVKNRAWSPVGEAGEFPAKGESGTYQIETGYGLESKSWYALRFNTATGEGWLIDGDEWKPIGN